MRNLVPFLLLASLPLAGSVRADDTPEHEAHELAEKMERAMKRAAESQREAVKRAEKRRKEEAEDLSEEQEHAREKAEKEARHASKLAAKSQTDPTHYEHEVLEEMEEGVENYLKLRRRALKTVTVPEPGPQATAQEIVAHQRALAKAIRARRPQREAGRHLPARVPRDLPPDHRRGAGRTRRSVGPHGPAGRQPARGDRPRRPDGRARRRQRRLSRGGSGGDRAPERPALPARTCPRSSSSTASSTATSCFGTWGPT